MKKEMTKKMLFAAVSAMSALCVWASPWSLPVKAAVEKVGVHAGGRVGGAVAARDGI